MLTSLTITIRPCRAAPARPVRRAVRHFGVRAAAEPQGPQKPAGGDNGDDDAAAGKRRKLDELKSSLQKMGIDKATAQRILSIWRQAGAESPEGLRKLFLRRSFNRSQQIGLQLLVDAASGAGAFYAARTITPQELGNWALTAKTILYFVSSYLWIGASFEFFSLLALFYAAYRYSTNADSFLLAVQDLAGSSTGLNVVDRAKQAVNIVKVLQALDQIRDLLKADNAESETFFASLGVFLTLERAQRLYGFEAERYGLTDAEAGDIAAVFARYDANDDGFIGPSEFQQLCRDNHAELSAAEVEAAFDLLDTDKSGFLDFGEWVDWFLQTQRQYGWKQGGKGGVLASGDEVPAQAEK